MATVKLDGNPVTTNGELPAVGSVAPAFKLTDGGLNDVGLDNFAGKKKILDIVVSLETSTCAISAKKFNQEAGSRDDVVVLVISADLPFAQGRFCSSEGIENVKTLSMMRDKNFAKDYGILMQDGPLAGLPTRSVVVLDEDNKVLYTQLVDVVSDEPDYASAIAAL